MLQSSMFPQLARLKLRAGPLGTRSAMHPHRIGPMKVTMKGAAAELKRLDPSLKHWATCGKRSVAVACELLNKGEVVAIPTDTIYGLAGLAQDSISVDKIYHIKKRSESKPLAICVGDVEDIKEWGITDNLPPKLLSTMLPGRVTVILKRRAALNPNFNASFENVGIRVPKLKFIRCVAKLVGPLALTSANISDESSTMYPDEFSDLWPDLGGIFYDTSVLVKEVFRAGSTVVDLSIPGYYKIVRSGCSHNYVVNHMQQFNLKEISE